MRSANVRFTSLAKKSCIFERNWTKLMYYLFDEAIIQGKTTIDSSLRAPPEKEGLKPRLYFPLYRLHKNLCRLGSASSTYKAQTFRITNIAS